MEKQQRILADLHPDLARQWHPTKNGELLPTQVTEGSNRKVWWLYHYEDLNTGKCFDFEWQAIIHSRIKHPGCPFLSGHAVWPGFNDLQAKNPFLASQWHPTKNGELLPTQVTEGSDRKVWWLYHYKDLKTGGSFDFEWQAAIGNRIKKPGCPFLGGHAVWPGFNDLQTKNPSLASQWHPTKNGELLPTQVTEGSNRKVWWLYHYEDLKTGGSFDFEWQAVIHKRVEHPGCPFLSGQAVWPGFNDLQTKNPSLASQWHPTKNGELLPTQVTEGSNRKVWWSYHYEDLKTGGSFDFEWQAIIQSRVRRPGCPILSRHIVWPGFNDLQTKNPSLASQWHPTKNGELLPTQVTEGSNRKVWWFYHHKDLNTGKCFDFEWQAVIIKRVKHPGCPFLSGHAVWPGFNDLQTKNPSLASQWHPSKNGKLTPSLITESSSQPVWWLFPYDDPKTKRHYEFEWIATVAQRKKHGCPFLYGNKVWPGFNDLETQKPEIASEWHPTRNRGLNPSEVTIRSQRKIWWKCKVCGHEWRTSIVNRTNNGTRCPQRKNHPQNASFV